VSQQRNGLVACGWVVTRTRFYRYEGKAKFLAYVREVANDFIVSMTSALQAGISAGKQLLMQMFLVHDGSNTLERRHTYCTKCHNLRSHHRCLYFSTVRFLPYFASLVYWQGVSIFISLHF